MTLVFFLSRLLPGDPSSLFISPGIPPVVAEQLRSQFGLDRPVVDQYIAWLTTVFHGELGYSFAHSAPVSQVLLSVFPNTLILGLSALVLECVLAILIAALAVSRTGSDFDRLLSNFTLVVYSLPSFWIGILLLLTFSFTFKLLPSSQMYSLAARDTGGLVAFADFLQHLILPALTVAIPGAAVLARYLRTNITDILGQEYVVAATGMGLSKSKMFRSYVLPNSVGPVISLLGIEVGVLLTGVLVTETLFAWPGMGRIAVMAIFSRDYPMILGCTLLGGCIVIVANILSDVFRAWIDPRVRLM
ncbi:MAG: binding-protein-dependent transport system inner rane component [Bacteroidetes bacterium]|nr:binding-protein-dependent transport system inner rane component [Bacteroidota bacterium]